MSININQLFKFMIEGMSRNNNESLNDEKILEEETGINSSILKKIKENPKLRKIFFSLILTTGLAGGIEPIGAQSKDINSTTIENSNIKNNFENLTKDIDIKNLKSLLRGYETAPGVLPLDIILEKFGEYHFKITNPIVGEFYDAANIQATEVLRLSGSLLNKTSRVFTFNKKIENGGVLVVKVVAYK